MPHRFNISQFRAANGPLVDLYCTLISIELRLKDSLSQWKHGHDVITLARHLGVPGVDTAAINLNQSLAALWCTGADGSGQPVIPNQYPHSRYLRHSTDFTPGSTDAQLADARRDARALAAELDRVFASTASASPGGEL